MSGVIIKLPQELQGKEWLQVEKDLITIENDTRTTLAQILGGFAVLFGLYFTYQTVKTSQDSLRATQDGKLTERFGKAVELLGSDKFEIRLGGIYALERIARDSEYDHWAVMEILTAYVRHHSPKVESTINPEDGLDEDLYPSTDIQTILNVIGKRKWIASETNDHQHLSFEATDLKLATLCKTTLVGANFSWASLYKADLHATNLQRANFEGTVLAYTNLCAADLSTSRNLTWEQVEHAFIDDKTNLPPDLEVIRRKKQKLTNET